MKERRVIINRCDKCGDIYCSFTSDTARGVAISNSDYGVLAAAADYRETERDILKRLLGEDES